MASGDRQGTRFLDEDLIVAYRTLPPGWYRDIANPALGRYWDGSTLSQERRVVVASPQPASEPAPPGPVASPAVAPGWYADPHSDGRCRYWDGTSWTRWTQTLDAAGRAPGRDPQRGLTALRRARWTVRLSVASISAGVALLLLVSFVPTVSSGNNASRHLSSRASPTSFRPASQAAPTTLATIPAPTPSTTVPATTVPTTTVPTSVAPPTAPATTIASPRQGARSISSSASPATTVPQRRVTAAPQRAPAVSTAPVTLEAALPDPTANIAPSPNFVDVCSATTYDDSFSCLLTVLVAIDNARATLGLPAMTLPANWVSLSPIEQLFVATNLERTVRGLAPLSTLDSGLDNAAAQGVATETDPVPPPGLSWTQWGGNWIDDIGNPLEAIYFWMYDDGLGSGNVDCTTADTSGCWSHWRNITLPLACTQCLMGAAWGQSAAGALVATQLIVETDSPSSAVLTWAQEQAYLP